MVRRRRGSFTCNAGEWNNSRALWNWLDLFVTPVADLRTCCQSTVKYKWTLKLLRVFEGFRILKNWRVQRRFFYVLIYHFALEHSAILFVTLCSILFVLCWCFCAVRLSDGGEYVFVDLGSSALKLALFSPKRWCVPSSPHALAARKTNSNFLTLQLHRHCICSFFVTPHLFYLSNGLNKILCQWIRIAF
jgi:hypothetical protein